MGPRDFDLAYNPFADDNTDEPTRNHQYFASAFLPNVKTPEIRRRSSLGASDSSFSTIRKRHSRSRTEFSIDISDSAIHDGHPLKSAAVKSSAFQDSEVTRPHLSRMVQSSSGMTRSASDTEALSGRRSPSFQEEGKQVIVHKITSKDSLAGVSLKYGIPLADLRRANHLWTSDSIHLRKDLYIPIDQAKRAHEYVSETQKTAERSSANPGSVADSTLPDIRRIPASQLSFFPPSTNPSRSHTPSETSPISNEFNTHHSPYLKSPGNRIGPSHAHSLTSLLTAFPIAASTRDEIVSRLSFDSVSSSYSDRPRSRAPSDQEIGHEMGNVQRSSFTQSRNDDMEFESPSVTTPRSSHLDEIPLATKTRDASSHYKAPYGKSLFSTSPPSSYVPQQPYNPYVRTQQLEPSPAMQFPSKTAHKSADRTASRDFAKKSPYRSTSAEPRNRSAKKSRENTPNIDYGIELERA